MTQAMRWPPSKAWTSYSQIKGYTHFVAINYGGKGENRWVNLVSVMDSAVRFRVKWNEIKNGTKWVSGWSQISNDADNKTPISDQSISDYDPSCLHPSKDSGLTLPFDKNNIRPW